MEKRMMLAVGLSIAVLLGFQLLGPKKEQQYTVQETMPARGTEQTGADIFGKMPAPGTEPLSPSTQLLPETLTEIKTDQYTLIFSDIGGSLKKIELNEYQEAGRRELLFEADSPATCLFAMRTPLIADLTTRKCKIRREGNVLEYQTSEPGCLEITKKYTFYKDLDRIDLSIMVKNLSQRRQDFSYQLTGPSELERTSEVAGRSFLEMAAMIDGKIWKTKSGKKEVQEKEGNIEWSALRNRYFTITLKAFTPSKGAWIQTTPDKNLITLLSSGTYSLAGGETIEENYLLYAGPLDIERLEALGVDLQGIVDYGFFGGLSKILIKALKIFHKVVNNWGGAIILLTLGLNLLMFPLTVKSFSSMHQMKKIQPHIQKLKDLHKDNPQKLNKETMELYKKNNVNPLGGCLPMLLQMPIFIALYQGLMKSVELKGANFLWIKDLAKPDAVPLPFSLPGLGASINVLPVLMAGMMVVQQKISQVSPGAGTKEQESQQKTMMMIMPVVFGFLFYNMPSGLVLYWLTNTILMTAEQGIIARRMA
ncbi:MAG: membrane protein insertase YidC [Candidatus Omnitrophota bacterium]